jgi:hypothetical protein
MALLLLIPFGYWLLVKLNGGRTKLDAAAERWDKSYQASWNKTFDPYK